MMWQAIQCCHVTFNPSLTPQNLFSTATHLFWPSTTSFPIHIRISRPFSHLLTRFHTSHPFSPIFKTTKPVFDCYAILLTTHHLIFYLLPIFASPHRVLSLPPILWFKPLYDPSTSVFNFLTAYQLVLGHLLLSFHSFSHFTPFLTLQNRFSTIFNPFFPSPHPFFYLKPLLLIYLLSLLCECNENVGLH